MAAAVVVPSWPVRTCIGCRRRTAATELFRVVVTPGPIGTPVSVVPDPGRRLPGRGAWLHPDPDCVALATRRHAFGRALRVPEPVDAGAVGHWVAERLGSTARRQHDPDRADQPQEMTSNEHSMKCQK